MPMHESKEHAAQKQARRKGSNKAIRNFDLNGKATSRHVRIMEAEEERRRTQRAR